MAGEGGCEGKVLHDDAGHGAAERQTDGHGGLGLRVLLLHARARLVLVHAAT